MLSAMCSSSLSMHSRRARDSIRVGVAPRVGVRVRVTTLAHDCCSGRPVFCPVEVPIKFRDRLAVTFEVSLGLE